MSVTVGDLPIVNVYAPNTHKKREEFFGELQRWQWPAADVILAGDFNSVQSPALDRLGGQRSGKPESAELGNLVRQLQLEDARTLEEHTEEDGEEIEPTQFFTYWGPEAASRLDRFYVPITWTAVVQCVSVDEPEVASDHQRVRIHFRDERQPIPKRRSRRGVTYPIRAAQQERVLQELIDELVEVEVGRGVTAASWDKTAKDCTACIRRVTKREKQQRKVTVHKISAQNRAKLVSRSELFKVTEEDVREEYLIRLGQQLERTTEQLRWSFKRVSNWEKDQTISNIRHINGEPFKREMSIANMFESEWKPVLGVVHNTIKPADLEEEFDKFVTIPPSRRVSTQQNVELMKETTADEVIQAIAALNRQKAAGPDGLNNDFFKDAEAVLVPAMVAIGNEMLKGGDPPASFLEALIIPLRKKGDSTDAMDFRPISLLQTGYKVYTKVIATRAQRVLGTPIGDSQQGFVHGRQMLKTVMMMLSILATANDEPGLAAELSQVILLLDFRKAYDTVAREFLFLALLKFGFSQEFVDMIRRLHDGTTATFLVNGELSDPQEVRSGIRQGCPLAPLLFILAAEILALAIKQNNEVTGIKVPRGEGERHKFSAFVDDSTVFLQQAQHVPRVMTIVENFGRLSGLQVQPTKSHLIFLNIAIDLKEYYGIPVLAHGETVRYLGYAVGTGKRTDVNWAGRKRAIQRRLATATQLATSIGNRVTLLNVIMLPSVLFTAAVFDMPNWANSQLCNLQKQFLWYHSTATGATRP